MRRATVLSARASLHLCDRMLSIRAIWLLASTMSQCKVQIVSALLSVDSVHQSCSDVSTRYKAQATMGLYHRISAFEHRERLTSLWIEFLASNGWSSSSLVRISRLFSPGTPKDPTNASGFVLLHGRWVFPSQTARLFVQAVPGKGEARVPSFRASRLPNYSFTEGYWCLHWTSSIELEAVCKLYWVSTRGLS